MRGAAAAAVFGVSAWAGAALAAEVRDPHGVAVVIGNRAYEERGVSDVAHAARDAQAFARYAREVLGFAGDNVLVLEDAGRREMLDALGDPKDPPEQRTSDLLYALDPRGRSDVVVFYSGHGAPGVEDRQGYLLPVDVRARDAQDDGYPIAALYDTLAARLGAPRRKARSVRVYLDACFSGRTHDGQLFAGASPALPVAALPEGVVEGMTVLSAGGPEEMAHWDEDARHGMFTRHLLDALYGGADENEDGKVTASEAWFYLEDFMSPAVWRRWRARQHAQLLPPLAPGPDDPGAILSSAPDGGWTPRPEIELASGGAVADADPDPPPDGEEPEVASGDPPPPSPPPPPDEAAEEKALGLDLADRKAVQRGLESLVGSVGHADGLFGRLTRTALRSWQENRGVPATGYLTRAQADALIAAGQEAAEAAARAQAEEERAAREKAERDRAARARAERERDDAAFASAERTGTVAAFEEYLASFPSGLHAAEARRLRDAARGPAVGEVFRDCPHCPEMVVVPAGSFMMGSPSSESGRNGDEGPQRRVTFDSPFAVGVYEVTFAEWDACVSDGGCGGYRPEDHGWGRGRRPVINVSWDDAKAYASWLSRETGESYRLLSEAEWEYAARAGTATARYWGESASGQCGYANGADRTAKRHQSGWTVVDCDDGHYRTVPVGSFRPNRFGLHDVLGNVWEWVEDCWHDSYAGAPRDGHAWLGDDGGDCSRRVLRGGSWGNQPEGLRTAYRDWLDAGSRYNSEGFRLLRSVRTFTP